MCAVELIAVISSRQNMTPIRMTDDKKRKTTEISTSRSIAAIALLFF